MMNSEDLEKRLEERLPQALNASFSADRIQVRHVLNWGGFVNQSFTVDAGPRRFHLKITDDVDNARKLRAWREVHGLLEARYRAPKVLQWVDLPDIGFCGLLQQHLSGKTAEFHSNLALLNELIDVATRLHNDDEIRSRLRSRTPDRTCLDYFVTTYIERFTGDLEAIVAMRPPFISEGLLRWMWDETSHLQQLAASEPAFARAADRPVHGDLHEGNIVVTSDDWFIVDWDDLAPGDPALEFAIVLWPLIYHDLTPPALAPPDEAFVKRFDLCLRAQLLDEVIDPLADFVAAAVVPTRKAEVQRFKKARHEEALEKYRAAWS